MTVSTRWITPLEARTSVAMTVAPLTVTPPPSLVTMMSSPPAVVTAVDPAGMSPALMRDGTT